ncbi:MAG: gliding motility-associated C-terminal domain-containing protein [Bacteroidota bacterium]
MKKTFYFVLFVFHLITTSVHSACPCNSTGCTFTSAAGNDPTAYSIGAGQKLCIPAGSTVTGNITLSGGGIISNQGTFSPSGFTFSNGTFDNCGLFTINLTVPAACVFNNCSNGTITNGSVTIGNTATFTNYGTVTITGSADGNFTIGNMSTFNNYGTICVSRDFICGNASTQNNYGVINTYNFLNANMSTFYNGCTVTISNNFTLSNGSIITGPTSGSVYGRFNVAGISQVNSGTIFGSGSEKLDMCDTGNPPGGFDVASGSVGPSVTFCANSGCAVIGAACCSPPIPAISGASTICSGNGTTLTASGGGTYSWSTGATTAAITVSPSSQTTYTVTVSNGGCSSAATLVVAVTTTPSAGISGGGTPICNGGSTTLTGTGGGTYSWLPGGAVTSAITVSPSSTTTYTVTVTTSGCTAKATKIITVNPNPGTSIISQGNVNCTGSATGSATVTVTGGTPTYNYLWNNGSTTSTVTGLTAGNYSVTITDASTCTATQSVVITQPASAVIANASGTNSTCGASNGSATVTASGGTGTLTYSWSPSGQTAQTAIGLSAATYNVIVTDGNGCTRSASAIVNNINGPTAGISGTVTNVNCRGTATGSATVTATGGTGTLTYTWNNGVTSTTGIASGLTAGTYNVIITDVNGCTATQSVTITQPASAVIANASGINATCGASNGSATVTASGGTGSLTYSWSPTGQTTTTATSLSAGTYTVTVTDANGCTQSASAIVNNTNGPTAGISGTVTNVNCRGNATGSATVTATGGTGALTYAWNNGVTSTTGTAAGLTAGTYIVTVTDANGCSQAQTINITEPTAALVASINGQGNVGCTGSATGSASATGTGGTITYFYLWSNGQTSNSITGLTAGSYNVTVTDANGCTATQAVGITQPASAIIATASSTNANCGASNGSATVTASGGTGTLTYSWSPSGQTTTTATNLNAGSYNVTITDANGCTGITSVNVSNTSGPVVGISGAVTNVNCRGNATGSATVTATGGTGTLTYTWNNGVTSTTATASGLTAGTYIVTVTDGAGCVQGQTITITEPTMVLGSSVLGKVDVGCTGSATGSASITGTGGTPTYIYSWSPGNYTTSSVTGLTSGVYTIIITDVNSCSMSQTVAITQPASGVNIISSSTDATCGNTNGTASVTASGGTPGYTYVWSTGIGTNSTASALSAGIYTVTITDANGCTKTENVTVANSGAPTVSVVSQSDADCNGSATGSATVSISGGAPGYTYNWAPAGGTATTAIGLTAGTYSFTVTDTNGCAQSQSITINEPIILNSSISSQTNVLCNSASTGTATISVTGGTPTYMYTWLPGGNSGATANGLTAGTYTVTISDSKGCTKNQNVIITEPSTSITTTPGSSAAACGSSNGTVSVTASGGTGLLTYSWTTPNNDITPTVTGLTPGTYTVIVSDSNNCTQSALATVAGSPGPSLAVSSKTNITCNGLTNGSATVTVSSGTPPYLYTWNPAVTTSNTVGGLSANTYTITVTDSAGCTSETTVAITEPFPITFTVSAFPATVCAGESITLTTSIPTGGTPPFTFIWLPAGPVVNPSIPATYSVTVTDSSGCSSQTDTILVTPLPSPIAGFDTLSYGTFSQEYLFTDVSINSTSWYWDFGDGQTSTSQNPTHTFSGAGIYIVTQIVTNTSGCSDTLIKIIIVRPNILIPNVFTPNDDGINDEFWIPNTGFQSFMLVIYNRWGIKLFETGQGQIRWDGRTSAGVEVSDGTYYYLLKGILKTETGGKDYESKGFIDLNRGR